MLSGVREDFIICGDFNQVEFNEQKQGGLRIIQGREEFSSWRINLRINELPFVGPRFTWCNNRSNGDRIYERLDRVYGSEEWIHKHPNAVSLNLPIMVSDHSPIILFTNPQKPKRKSLIKIESWALNFKEVKQVIEEKWRRPTKGSPMFKVARQLGEVRYQLFK